MKNNLATLRIEAGITQKELSAATGIPVRTIQEWECGNRNLVDIYKIHRIAQVLGCTIEDIVELEGE